MIVDWTSYRAHIIGMDKISPHAKAAIKESRVREIALRLALSRQAFGLTKSEFARMAGITENYWVMFENGDRRISLDAALKLKASFRLPLDWIYEGDRTNLPPKLEKYLRKRRA